LTIFPGPVGLWSVFISEEEDGLFAKLDTHLEADTMGLAIFPLVCCSAG
jgi:hypothetical protein